MHCFIKAVVTSASLILTSFTSAHAEVIPITREDYGRLPAIKQLELELRLKQLGIIGPLDQLRYTGPPLASKRSDEDTSPVDFDRIKRNICSGIVNFKQRNEEANCNTQNPGAPEACRQETRARESTRRNDCNQIN
jgi:hypothetical protein